jgi:hypothetical protein
MVNALYTDSGSYDVIYFSENKWKKSSTYIYDLETFNIFIRSKNIYYLKKQATDTTDYMQNLVNKLNKAKEESVW